MLRNLLLLLIILLLVGCIEEVSVLPKFEMKFECSPNVNCTNGKVIGKKGETFTLNYTVPKKYENWKVNCYCSMFNNQTHPLSGKICGGYGFVKGGKAITKGWVIDFEEGNSMSFKCFLEKNEKKEFEVEITIVSVS